MHFYAFEDNKCVCLRIVFCLRVTAQCMQCTKRIIFSMTAENYYASVLYKALRPYKHIK